MRITRNIYLKLKKQTASSEIPKIAKRSKVSKTTLYRIRKSRSFPDYKRIAVADSNRGIKPYNTTNVEDIVDEPVKKKGFLSWLTKR